MSDVFISYASADRSVAQSLAEAFEAMGWSVWWDRNIPAGSQFDRVIDEQLAAARCVVVVWSKESVASQWVRAEAGEAARREVMIPVVIEDVKIPLAFRIIQAAQLAGWRGESAHPEFEKVVKTVSRLLGSEPTLPKPAQKQSSLPWIFWLTSGVLGVVLVIGVLYYATGYFERVTDRTMDREDMVLIPAGDFMMGSTEQEAKDALVLAQFSHPGWAEPEQPRHRVVLDAFWMDKFEVTVEKYRRFLKKTGRKAHEGFDDAPDENHPVTAVTWVEADDFCRWTGKDLPTEAQWEYASRGGKRGLKYPWGDGDAPVNGSRANFCDANCPDLRPGSSLDDDGYWSTAPVGSYPAGKSTFGVHDLAGNAAEWVRDWYDKRFFEKSPVQNPVNTQANRDQYRVIRGGSYLDGPYFLRSAARSFRTWDARHPTTGFRCVSLESQEEGKL
ncbi:MAG: SUMF1/EgtB/PvdO family nonheme iron enzyme [Pseudomonadota bacterium]